MITRSPILAAALMSVIITAGSAAAEQQATAASAQNGMPAIAEGATSGVITALPCPTRHSVAYCIAEFGGFSDGLSDATGEVAFNPSEARARELTRSIIGASELALAAAVSQPITPTSNTVAKVIYQASVPLDLAADGISKIATSKPVREIAPGASMNHVCAYIPRDSAPTAADAAMQLHNALKKAVESAFGPDYQYENGESSKFFMSSIRISGSGACTFRDCVAFLPNERVEPAVIELPAWLASEAALPTGTATWSLCGDQTVFGVSGGLLLNPREMYQRMSVALPAGVFLYAAPDGLRNKTAAVFNRGKQLSFGTAATPTQ
jgi:hypothetical protein